MSPRWSSPSTWWHRAARQTPLVGKSQPLRRTCTAVVAMSSRMERRALLRPDFVEKSTLELGAFVTGPPRLSTCRPRQVLMGKAAVLLSSQNRWAIPPASAVPAGTARGDLQSEGRTAWIRAHLGELPHCVLVTSFHPAIVRVLTYVSLHRLRAGHDAAVEPGNLWHVVWSGGRGETPRRPVVQVVPGVLACCSPSVVLGVVALPDLALVALMSAARRVECPALLIALRRKHSRLRLASQRPLCQS